MTLLSIKNKMNEIRKKKKIFRVNTFIYYSSILTLGWSVISVTGTTH